MCIWRIVTAVQITMVVIQMAALMDLSFLVSSARLMKEVVSGQSLVVSVLNGQEFAFELCEDCLFERKFGIANNF